MRYEDHPPFGRRPGCGARLLHGIATAWAIGLPMVGHIGIWCLGQMLIIMGQEPPTYIWLLLSLGLTIILLVPMIILLKVQQHPQYQTAYRSWAVAGGYALLLAFVRLIPEMWKAPAALAQIVLSLNACAVLALATARYQPHTAGGRGATALALVLTPALIIPWLTFGALGSPLDTLLNLAAGLSLGLFAGLLLSRLVFGPLYEQSTGRHAGRIAAVVLAILGGGFGFAGQQVLLLIVLPPLGLLLAGLARRSKPYRAWLPLGLLVGLVSVAPLVLIDPNELSILLGDYDVLHWALMAAGVTLCAALLAGLILGRLTRPSMKAVSPTLSIGAGAVTWLLAALVYMFLGQPGFFGDRLFVILNSQPELRAATGIHDRVERINYVYRHMSRFAETNQAPLRSELDRRGVRYTPYYLVNALEADGGFLLRLSLARRPDVDRILDSPRLRPLPAPVPRTTGEAPTPSESPWNIRLIGADRVWRELGVAGQGIVIGHSDSGVDASHPALAEGYRGYQAGHAYHWLDPWSDSTEPRDISGHGTHTLGTAVGRGGIGVAPEAEWFACVNLERNLGNPALYLDCLQFMLAPHPPGGDPFHDGQPKLAAHVINNSWGCPPFEGCDAESLWPAVTALRAAGIFVVAAAGNEGPLCSSIQDPLAIYPETFSVGAMDAAGDLAIFSSRGPVMVDGSGRLKPDLIAPGVQILSAMPGRTYAFYDGTSMAAPHVAGVVALMWSAQPALIGDIERTEQILVQTAHPYQGARVGCFDEGTPNIAYGHGILDAYAAVRASLELE